MTNFSDLSLEAALDRSLKNATHLRAVHAGVVKAARLLARKIDAWDVIVEWAIEDAEERGKGARPAVPQNDNVSIASFLKYMDTLGLTPSIAPRAEPVKARAAVKAPPSPVDDLAAMREQMRKA